MTGWGGGSGARAAAGALLVLVLVLGGAGALPAQAAVPVPAGQARAQAVLDRVLGPGGALVEVAATVRTGAASVDTVRYGPAVTAASATGAWTSGTGSAGSSLRLDAVDRTSSAVVIPAGGLIRQTVSVAIDRGALGTRSVAGLRRLVAAAVGLVPGRGDRMVVAVLRFARPAAAAAAPAQPWTAALLPLAVPAMQGAGVLAGALILLRALGVGRRRRSAAGGLTPR